MLEVNEDANGIITLILNNPPANALNSVLLRDFVIALRELREDPNVRGVLLTGQGERFFCAGGDTKEFSDMTRELGSERMRLASNVKAELHQLECPYVVAVNGTAVGSGLEMTAIADFSVASTDARFGMPEINHGLLPMAKGVQQLVKRIGENRTKEILFSGHIFSAQEALSYGIVDEVVSPDKVRPRAREWLEEMAAKAPSLFASLKRTIRESPEMSDASLERLTELDFHNYFQTEDAVKRLESIHGPGQQ